MQRDSWRYCKKGIWILIIILSLNVALTSTVLSFAISKKDSIPLNIRVMFDLKKDESLTWNGTIRVTEGIVDKIKGIGFEHDDKIFSQSNSWRCVLTKKPCGPCGEVVTSKGLMLNISSPLNATCILATKAGNFCFPLRELSLGKTIERYDGRLQIGLAPRNFLLSPNNAQDDSPSMAVDKSGRVWACWVSHKKGKDRIVAKRYEQGKWSDEIEVTQKAGSYYKPVVTGDSKGGVWVVWPAYQKGNWDLYARNYTGSRWSGIKRLTKDSSNDINQKILTDPLGKVWLCWESYRNGNADIFIRYLSDRKWSKAIQITRNEANDRQPDLAFDNLGKTYISWARFDNGLYRILLKEVNPLIGTEKTIAVSEKPLAHPSIACAQDKVWVAWDEIKNARQSQKEKTDTKDFFYALRGIGLRCYKNGSLFEPVTDMYKGFPFPLKQHTELPELTVDKNGRLWVFFHNYVSGLPHSVWRVYGLYYQGDEWSQPVLFPNYTWKNVASVDSCCDNSGNLWIAWGSDSRDFGSGFLSDRDIYAGYMSLNDNVKRSASIIYCDQCGSFDKGRPGENDKEAPYQVRIKGEDYKLVWGALYQPNNVRGYSGLDGFITDIYRSIMDDGGLDFLGIGNYLSYDNKEYTRWLADKANYLFSEPDQFVSVAIPEKTQNQIYKCFNNLESGKNTAVIGAFVNDLSPESIQEALNKKRVYIATGKIILDANILGHPMGEGFKTKENVAKIDVMVVGTEKIYQIDIYRNDACIYSRLPKGKYTRFSFLDVRMPKGTNHYYIKVIQEDAKEACTLTSALNAI